MFSSGSRLGVWGAAALVAGGAALVAVRAGAADGPQGASPDRVAAVKHVMAGIHAPHCGAIGRLLKGEGPKEDQAWAELALHAALLNESGHLLMENGRCPDGVWSDATAGLRRGSAGVYAAAGKKDFAAAQAGFKEVTASCQACHAGHKDKPAAVAAAPPASTPAVAAATRPAAPAPAAKAAVQVAPEPADNRVATIRHLMAGINSPNCAALGQVLRNEGPGDEKGWQDVVRFAALLNEAGFLLMDNRRCQDEVWKDAAVNLRANSAKVVHAGTIRNLEDARIGYKG